MTDELTCLHCKAVTFKEHHRMIPNRDRMKDMYCNFLKKYVEDYYDTRHPECPLRNEDYVIMVVE